MGQFLAIGIKTDIFIQKDRESKNLTLEDIIGKMTSEWHFDASLYDFSENEKSWKWKLKETLFDDDFLAFLKAFYAEVYTNRNADEEEVIQKLSESPAADWLAIASDKSYEAFQKDNYCESDYLRFMDKDFRPTVTIDFQTIMLAMAGKIMIESSGGLFHFFEKMIDRNFSNFKISKAIKVYITG